MDILKRNRGRPKKEGSKNCRCEVRMSEDDLDILNNIMLKTGKNKAEIIREAIDLYSKMVEYRRD